MMTVIVHPSMFIPVYVLTLRDRPDRSENIKTMEAAGVEPRVFYGFNGKTIGVSSTRPYMRDHRADPSKHQPTFLSPGVLGCALTWMALAKHVLVTPQSTHQYVMVFEDDAIIPEGFWDTFTEYYQQLPENWDILHLGYGCHEGRPVTQISKNIVRYDNGVLMTHAMLIRRRVFEMIDAMPEMQTLENPIDVAIYDYILPKVQHYQAYPLLVEQLSAKGLARSCM